jgi:hypothetical protein
MKQGTDRDRLPFIKAFFYVVPTIAKGHSHSMLIRSCSLRGLADDSWEKKTENSLINGAKTPEWGCRVVWGSDRATLLP